MPDLNFREEMVDFVAEISEYAKSKDSTFYIFSHNAAERWSESGYLEAVDGIGQEAIYYGIATSAEVTY